MFGSSARARTARPRYSGDSVMLRSNGWAAWAARNALGSHEAGGDGDRGHAVLPQVVGHSARHANDGCFRQVVVDVAQVLVERPGDGADDQAAGLGDHQRRGQLACDQLGSHAGDEHAFPLRARLVPEGDHRDSECLAFVAAPDVVDEQVQAAVLGSDALEECFDVVVDRVVAVDRDAVATAGGDFVGGIVDGSWQAIDGGCVAGGAACDVDRCAGFAQNGGDCAAGAAAGAGYDCDFVFEASHALVPCWGCLIVVNSAGSAVVAQNPPLGF